MLLYSILVAASIYVLSSRRVHSQARTFGRRLGISLVAAYVALVLLSAIHQFLGQHPWIILVGVLPLLWIERRHLFVLLIQAREFLRRQTQRD